MFTPTTQGNFENRRAELEDLASQDLGRAFDLDPALGSPYATLGTMHYANWRGADAQEAFERALDLSPNDSAVMWTYSRFSAYVEQHESAIRLAERALELDPNNPSRIMMLAVALEASGDLSAALTERRKVTRSDINHVDLATLEVALGNNQQAEKELLLVESRALNSTNPSVLAQVVYGYARLGLREDAERLSARFDEIWAGSRIPASSLIMVSLARGEDEEALDWLTRAAEEKAPYEGFGLVMRIKANVFRDPVLDQPRFVEVREKLALIDP